VVRHSLVQRIIKAYENFAAQNAAPQNGSANGAPKIMNDEL